MAIGSIDTNTPQGTAPVSEGDNQIVGIKVDVVGSFPAFLPGVDVVATKTGPEIEDGAEKSADETITGKWSFADRANVENNVSFAGRTTTPSIASFLRINTSNEMEFGEPTSPGVFKNNAMTVEGEWNFEQRIILNNDIKIIGKDTGGTNHALIATSDVDTTEVGNFANPTNLIFQTGGLQHRGIIQPSSNYCLSVTNGSTTKANASGGASGWTVAVINTTTLRITHSLGSAVYVAIANATSGVFNAAVISAKATNSLDVVFANTSAIPADVMVMVP